MLAGIWYLIIMLILVIYVLLDGFELGGGALSAFAGDKHQRHHLIANLDGVWHANEMWLVLLGAVLCGAFPTMCGLIAHGLYIPIALMLLGLAARGSGNYLCRNTGRKKLANLTYSGGSLAAALGQGFALGGVIQGVQVVDLQFSGGPWDWLSPASTLTAVGVVSGYTLLGATYLVMKTHGEIAVFCRRAARVAALVLLGATLGVYRWLPHLQSNLTHKWSNPSDFHYLVLLAVFAGFAYFMLFHTLARRRMQAPFFWSLVILAVSLATLSLSCYPYLVPGAVTAAESAAPDNILVVMLTGIGILIPVMLSVSGYRHLTAWDNRDVNYSGTDENENNLTSAPPS